MSLGSVTLDASNQVPLHCFSSLTGRGSRYEVELNFKTDPLLPCFAIFWFFGVERDAIAAVDEAVFGGFLVVQDGAAGLADGDARFDFFRADRAIVEGFGVVQPRFFHAEEAGGAA